MSVAFCIHCGAQNTTDATFCLSCGQILYHDPKTTIPPESSIWQRYRLLFGTILFVIGAILIVVLSASRSNDPKRNAGNTTEVKRSSENTAEHSSKTPLGAPVLTIVASNRTGTTVSQGSGFILSSDGLAGSNFHVIKGSVQAMAECCNGRVFELRSIEGADLEKDLVVFQLYERGRTDKPRDLPFVTLGSSKDLAIGDKVIAIGSPQGLENTVSDGILSAVREYKSVRYLQITAPISPGSSGGPVLSESGKMVGVATFQFEKGQNLNFAVDSEQVSPLIDQHLGISLPAFQSVVGNRQHSQPKVGTRATDSSPPGSAQPDEEPPLTGQYGGIVHNRSANLSGNFGILVRDDEGILSGCMGVQAPLFGSGPLSGFAVDDDVSFAVTSSIGKITFTGRRSTNSITGSYVVERESRSSEEGTFTLEKARPEGLSKDFDTANCPTDAEIHK
jgi:S1-C subfamily serine protease